MRRMLTFDLSKTQICFGLIGLLLAVACPFVAVYFEHYVDSLPGLETIAIVYTTKDIGEGELITRYMLKMGTIPVGRLPRNTSIKVKSFDQAVGRVSEKKVPAEGILDVRDLWVQIPGSKLENHDGLVKGSVLHAVKEIQEGDVITKDALELKMEPISQIERNALTSIGQAVGHIAARLCRPGNIIFSSDVQDQRLPAKHK